MTDNILFSYISMFSFLVRLFAVFLLHFQRMSALDLIKTIKKRVKQSLSITLIQFFYILYSIHFGQTLKMVRSNNRTKKNVKRTRTAGNPR